MDGLLVVDKPAGPTSHDVVERARRALGERRIGHTGTLDPAATGVLCLVLGRATRLAQFVSGSDKTYEAVVRFGFATDTNDATGRATGTPAVGPTPAADAIDRALEAFRGTFLQQPPAFSAKKIAGTPSHRLARRRARGEQPAAPPQAPVPVSVTAHRIEVVGAHEDTVTLIVTCSSGFYVRSLAHDLGERLGVGAHLAALRRIRSGAFTIEQALTLEEVERDPVRTAAAVVPLEEVLVEMPAFSLSAEGVRRAINGCQLGRADSRSGEPPSARATLHRLLDPSGRLVGIGRAIEGAGLLHPTVILS
jgi:tRNA pseudouridine55 synthase